MAAGRFLLVRGWRDCAVQLDELGGVRRYERLYGDSSRSGFKSSLTAKAKEVGFHVLQGRP